MAILGKIPNFDPKKGYPEFGSKQPNTKLIPIYPTKCSCHYGWKCDDEEFDYSEPVGWKEVALDDERTEIYDNDKTNGKANQRIEQAASANTLH